MRDGIPQRLLRAWGLQWRSELVWDKVRLGTGRYLRGQTEVLMLATSGRLPLLRQNQGSCLRIRATRHSEKPPAVRQLLETLSPGPRIELFARGHVRGWDTWGFEALQNCHDDQK